MATPVLIPVEEYLNTTYRPDCDYLDGEVRERNLGEKPHGTIQGFLYAIFLANRKAWGVRAFTEQRVQINPARFRVPDVCVLPLGDPPDPIIYYGPLICIEIFSRDDSKAIMEDRITDYLAIGVENIWLFDPVRRRAFYANADGIHPLQEDSFTVPGTPIRIPIADLNTELDELAAGR